MNKPFLVKQIQIILKDTEFDIINVNYLYILCRKENEILTNNFFTLDINQNELTLKTFFLILEQNYNIYKKFKTAKVSSNSDTTIVESFTKMYLLLKNGLNRKEKIKKILERNEQSKTSLNS